MSTSLEEISDRLSAVESRLDQHIHDGIEVWKGLGQLQTDVTWIKRGIWASIGLGGALGACLLKFVLYKAF